MKKIVPIATIAVVLALGAAALAQDAASTRHALMESIAEAHYGVLGRMSQGRVPYEQPKVDAAFAAIAGDLAKFKGTLFPPDSNRGPIAGSNYYAAPAAFQNAADIDAKVADVLKAIADNKDKAKDPASLRAAYTAINGQCNACHDKYRLRKS